MAVPALDADVLILCGGMGRRLGSAAGGLPKPLVDIGGRPFLEILINQAKAQGVSRFVLCAGFKAELLQERFSIRPDIAMSTEPRPLGTAGALKHAAALCGKEELLVMNGDSLCEGLDLRGLLDWRRTRESLGALAVVSGDGWTDVGTLNTDESGRITNFIEKGLSEAGRFVNAGVYAFHRRLLDLIDEGPQSLETDVLPSILDEGIYAFPVSGPLWDIGTPERLKTFRSSRAG